MHGSGKEAQAVPELQAGWLAVLMPDPVEASDGVPDIPMPGAAVAAAAAPHLAVTGVVTAAQHSEEGGVTAAGAVGNHNVTDEESEERESWNCN
jgi:hypothetical protein